MKLLEIYEGWRNHLVPPSELKEIIEQVKEERMEICRKCAFNSINIKDSSRPERCVKCGCILVAKTACLHCKCPLENPKWGAVDVKEKENGEEK